MWRPATWPGSEGSGLLPGDWPPPAPDGGKCPLAPGVEVKLAEHGQVSTFNLQNNEKKCGLIKGRIFKVLEPICYGSPQGHGEAVGAGQGGAGGDC